jgi:thiamine-monophosphate kinase
MDLKDIGEFGFIDRIKPETLVRPEGVIKGIGDDCSVFRTRGDLVALLTTDMLVEGVHFQRERIPPYTLGRKSIAINLSDIAAMGGNPREALISIAIPETVPVEYLDSVYEGMKSMAREFGVNLLGGDTTSSPSHLVINVALVGEAREEEVLYRSGAEPGDVLFLTGPVGASAAGLDSLLMNRSFEGQDVLLEAQFDPQPHVQAGRIISGLRVAHSLIDVSDGLAGDLGHICTESKVGAIVEEGKIPTTEPFRAYCNRFGLDPMHLAMHVGEDYVLLGTVPAESSSKLKRALEAGGCAFFPIGRIVGAAGIQLVGRDGSGRVIRPSGWDHFRRSATRG